MDSKAEYTASDYLQAFRRRRGILFKVAIPIVTIAAAFALLLPDKYTSVAHIDINLEGSNVRMLEPIEVSTYADQYVSDLQERVVTRKNLLELANDNTLIVAAGEELSEDARIAMIRDSIEVSVVTQTVTSASAGREVDLITGFRAASTGAEPAFVFQVAEYLAMMFLEEDRKLRTERATSTALFLKEQKELTEKEIRELEQAVAEFKVVNACCLPELINLNTSVIQRAERDLDSMEPRIRTLSQNRRFLQAQIDEMRMVDSGTNRLSELEQEYMTLVANYGPDHPDVNRVRREIQAISSADASGGDTFELIDLRAKLSAAEQKYSSEHPDVIRFKREIAILEGGRSSGPSAAEAQLRLNPRYIQLRAELNSVDTELNELRRNQPALRAKIVEYEERLARTPQVESEFQAIDRRLQSARDTFDDLQGRAVIARQSEALESTDIGARLALVSRAVLPQLPSGPPRLAILILGVFLAGTFGIGGMLFAETADNTVRSSKDIAVVMDMVPLATIPMIVNSVSKAHLQRKKNMIIGAALVVITAIAVLYFGVL